MIFLSYSEQEAMQLLQLLTEVAAPFKITQPHIAKIQQAFGDVQAKAGAVGQAVGMQAGPQFGVGSLSAEMRAARLHPVATNEPELPLGDKREHE